MTDKNKISDILKKNQLFKGLSKKELQSIVSDNRSSLVKYPPREVIYTDKSFKKALGAVISGSVSVFRVGNGSRVLLNKIDETGIFGAASLFGAEEQFVTEIIALTESESSSYLFLLSDSDGCTSPDSALALRDTPVTVSSDGILIWSPSSYDSVGYTAKCISDPIVDCRQRISSEMQSHFPTSRKMSCGLRTQALPIGEYSSTTSV